MAKAVIMPKFGFTQENAEVLAWLKNEGDTVDAGDPIMEVSTDKVSMEVEAPVSGVLAGFKYKVGDVVPVTEIVCYILAAGEVLDALTPDVGAQYIAPLQTTSPTPMDTPLGADTPLGVPTPPALSDAGNASPLAARMAQDAGVDIRQIAGTGPRGKVTQRDVEAYLAAQGAGVGVQSIALAHTGGKPNAVPAARRVAAQLGVPLNDVRGSGPGGRIQSADVQAYVAELKAATAAAEPAPVAAADAPLVDAPLVDAPLVDAPLRVPTDNAGVAQRIPFNNMRRTIARNLQKSMQDAPHIYFTTDIDMTAANALVAYANANAPEGVKVTLTALITRAVAWTLRRHTLVNSHLNGEEVLVMSSVNVGIAVALENGLIVPVVRDADRKGIYELATEIRALGQAAQAGKLGLNDIQGATFTISNLGMFGVDKFTAIINPPQVGILAVGRARKVFVPDEHDQPVVRPLAAFTLSVDHRAIDGAVAARFISDLAQALATPERILL
jgi:pyruvate dehydrogenase E2 component (dihydrolipoamide acetyltransferase)